MLAQESSGIGLHAFEMLDNNTNQPANGHPFHMATPIVAVGLISEEIAQAFIQADAEAILNLNNQFDEQEIIIQQRQFEVVKERVLPFPVAILAEDAVQGIADLFKYKPFIFASRLFLDDIIP